MEKDHLRDLSIDEKILKSISKEQCLRMWNEFIWVRIGSSDWILWIRQWNFSFHKVIEICWVIMSFSRRILLHEVSRQEEAFKQNLLTEIVLRYQVFCWLFLRATFQQQVSQGGLCVFPSSSHTRTYRCHPKQNIDQTEPPQPLLDSWVTSNGVSI